ncbi:unnamed protein product [Arabidopsis halleri]
MPPKKTLQATLEEHNDAFRLMMTEFQQSLSNTLRTTMETAVRTLAQAQRNAAPVLPQHEEPDFDDIDEEEENVHSNLEISTAKYKSVADVHRRNVEFKVGDLVWAVLTKDRFKPGTYNKLKSRKIGPLEIVEKINNNAYRLKLPPHMHTADVFNVKHLVPFEAEDEDENSRANFLLTSGDLM